MTYKNDNIDNKNINRCKHGITPESCCAFCNEFKRQEQEAKNNEESC